MAEPWIRVHANLRSKPVVFRAVEALGVSRAEAVGLLVTFWGEASQHAPNGRVGDYPDAQLEAWAGWERKRGKFAAFIRAHHLDAEGRVNEWDEYAGVLEEQRRQSRSRKRKSRGSHSDGTVQSRGSSQTSSPTIRDDTIREEELQHLQQPTGAELEAEAGLAVLLATDADRNALTVVVARASDRGACIQAFRSMLTGNDPATPQPTAGDFGQALRDMAANGNKPSSRLMRGYLRDVGVERLRAEGPGRPPRSGGDRAGARPFATPDDTADALAQWARDTEARETHSSNGTTAKTHG